MADFGIGARDFHARLFFDDAPFSGQIDPMTETFYNKTPYGLFGQNPISRIDPDGMSDYTINTDGYFQMVRQTDDKFDMLYTHAAYSEGNFDDGLKISDQELLPQFLMNRNIKQKHYSGKEYSVYYARTNNTDAKNVFEFASENTEFEWSRARMDDGFSMIGTALAEDMGVNLYQYEGYTSLNLLRDYHSHPGTNPYDDKASNTHGLLLGDVQRAGNIITKHLKANGNDYSKIPRFFIYRPHYKTPYYFEYDAWNSKK